MNCVICWVELVEETIAVPAYREDRYGAPPPHTVEKATGYQYCPSCGLVYKEIK